MGIAWLYGSIRPICLNAVIVRMRAGEIGLKGLMERTEEGVLLEGRFGDLQLCCRFDFLFILPLICSRCVHTASPSHAIRNLVGTGVSGKRRSIDMVSSEYAYLAPQSQHTR